MTSAAETPTKPLVEIDYLPEIEPPPCSIRIKTAFQIFKRIFPLWKGYRSCKAKAVVAISVRCPCSKVELMLCRKHYLELSSKRVRCARCWGPILRGTEINL